MQLKDGYAPVDERPCEVSIPRGAVKSANQRLPRARTIQFQFQEVQLKERLGNCGLAP